MVYVFSCPKNHSVKQSSNQSTCLPNVNVVNKISMINKDRHNQHTIEILKEGKPQRKNPRSITETASTLGLTLNNR